MVLLTMTPAIVAAVEKFQELGLDTAKVSSQNEPRLLNPAPGNPISHGQILDISRSLLAHLEHGDSHEISSYHLAHLLRGSSVYVEPPKPKAEPPKTSEYKELMARLRKEQEARAYASMIDPAPQANNPFKILTAPNTAAAWDLQNGNSEADEMKFSEINQQLALIINVLLSIIACSVAVWLLMRHWSVPARLMMSMLCSLLVGVAEVVVYAAYVRKLGQAKAKEKTKAESRQITDTWVIKGTTHDTPSRITSDSPNGESPSAGTKRRPARRQEAIQI